VSQGTGVPGGELALSSMGHQGEEVACGLGGGIGSAHMGSVPRILRLINDSVEQDEERALHSVEEGPVSQNGGTYSGSTYSRVAPTPAGFSSA
jgi:hypothetical protein